MIKIFIKNTLYILGAIIITALGIPVSFILANVIIGIALIISPFITAIGLPIWLIKMLYDKFYFSESEDLSTDCE